MITAAALQAALLASDSATAVLERICGAPVHIRRLAAPVPPPRPIALPHPEEASHRRVALLCGARTLSEADLWYLPRALTPTMALAIAETDAPFGRVVRALALRRQTLAARLGEADAAVAVEHRALLCCPAGLAVAEVWERYGRELVSGS